MRQSAYRRASERFEGPVVPERDDHRTNTNFMAFSGTRRSGLKIGSGQYDREEGRDGATGTADDAGAANA